MDEQINKLVEQLNSYMAHRPGVVPLLGLILIFLNLLVQLYPGPDSWLAASNLLLHLGLLLSIGGLLLVNVYRR